MLPEELFLSLCRLQCPGPQLVLLGSRVLGAVHPTLAWGALLGPGRRRPSHVQSCFPVKENTLGVGFRFRRTPTKQQGPGSQRQPSPALPDGERRAGCETACVAFLSKGAVWLVCAPQGAFPVPLQTAGPSNSVGAFGELGPWCGVAQLHLGCIAGAWAKKAYTRSILLPHKGEHVGSVIQAPKTPCKAAGLRDPGAAQHRFAGLRAGGWVRKRLA